MADKMKNKKEMKKNKKGTKANSSKTENETGKNKMESVAKKNMTEDELRENSMEANVNKYTKEKGEKKNRKRKFNVENCLESPPLKAHCKNPNKSVKFNSRIIEDNLKDVSKYDIQDIMEVYMTYVNYRNLRKVNSRLSINLSSKDRSLENTFSAIFTRYEECLESFMKAYEKHSDAKIMTQTKRKQGRRLGNKTLQDAGRENYLYFNVMQNILKGGSRETVEPEVAASAITSKDILRGLESDAELEDLLKCDNKARVRKRKVKH